MRDKELLIKEWRETGAITDERLLKAFKEVKRENFILLEYKSEAYGDYPLPIHAEQTISQPTTVMIMTQALELKEGDKVLEVGAGSGYQAAIIAKMVGQKGKVITTEIISQLAGFAEQNLKKEGITNVKVLCWDGSKGYKREAPYDKIIVTAATPAIPKPLIEQLKDGGIIVAPVGDYYTQEMIVVKKEKGRLRTSSLGYFRFVPLKGEYGF